MVTQLLKQVVAFYGDRKASVVFTGAFYWDLWPSWAHSRATHFLRSFVTKLPFSFRNFVPYGYCTGSVQWRSAPCVCGVDVGVPVLTSAASSALSVLLH